MKLINKFNSVICLFLLTYFTSVSEIQTAPIPKAKERPKYEFKEGYYRMTWAGTDYVYHFLENKTCWGVEENANQPPTWQGTWSYDKKNNTLFVTEKLACHDTPLEWSGSFGKPTEVKEYTANIYFKGETTTRIYMKLLPYTHKPKKVEY